MLQTGLHTEMDSMPVRKPVTIRDVARAAGVSPATVSFVLNNGPRPVSTATRTRVEEVVRKMNFRPNAVARGLARRRMNIIGVHFSHVESPIVTNFYATGLLAGVFAVARERNFDVLLLTQPWRGAQKSLSMFQDGRTDGLLLIAPDETGDLVPSSAALGVPLVAVAASPGAGDKGVRSVGIDNRLGIRTAVRHLYDLGHRRIGHISGEDVQFDGRERRAAFREICAELDLTDTLVVDGTFDNDESEALRASIRELLQSANRPTALVCASDNIASTVYHAVADLGLSIPNDLSVTGFDDAPIALQLNPELTTLRQPLHAMGATAASLVIDQIADRSQTTEPHLLAPELQVRGSTAPYPAA